MKPNSSNAEKEWTPWIKTFGNFAQVPTTPKDFEIDKLSILIKFVSLRIYETISECTIYNDALNTLKKPSETYKQNIH